VWYCVATVVQIPREKIVPLENFQRRNLRAFLFLVCGIIYLYLRERLNEVYEKNTCSMRLFQTGY
jgi:hypothetical protein